MPMKKARTENAEAALAPGTGLHFFLLPRGASTSRKVESHFRFM